MKEDILNAPIGGTDVQGTPVYPQMDAQGLASVVDRIKNTSHRRSVSKTAEPRMTGAEVARCTNGEPVTNPYRDRVGAWVEGNLRAAAAKPASDLHEISSKRAEWQKARWTTGLDDIAEQVSLAEQVEYAKSVASQVAYGSSDGRYGGGGGASEMFKSVDEYRDRYGIPYGVNTVGGTSCGANSAKKVKQILGWEDEKNFRDTALTMALEMEKHNEGFATAANVRESARVFFDFLSGDVERNDEDD